MTLDEVIKRLFDGLDKTEDDFSIAKKRLTKLCADKGINTEQLDNLCFEDSCSIIDYIYEGE